MNIPNEERESRRVQPEEWEVHWPHISESLDRIPQHWSDYWTKESIFEQVMRGEWQAWGFGTEPDLLNVIVLTQLIDYPAGRVLQIVLAFGNHVEECLPVMEAVLERFAIVAGARWCEICGRTGWERKLPRFRRRGVILRAEVPKIGVH
jgi:hypothetical protein